MPTVVVLLVKIIVGPPTNALDNHIQYKGGYKGDYSIEFH